MIKFIAPTLIDEQLTYDQSLVLKLKQGDKKAFEELYSNYSSALYGVVLRIVISEEIANEVLQEAFVKIWKNILQFDETKGTIFTWMLNVARNSAIDRTRKIKRENEISLQTYETSKKDRGLIGDEIKIDHIGLREIVNSLNKEQQVILDYLYFRGYTQQEISDELSIALGTVKTRTRAALGELRKIMNN